MIGWHIFLRFSRFNEGSDFYFTEIIIPYLESYIYEMPFGAEYQGSVAFFVVLEWLWFDNYILG